MKTRIEQLIKTENLTSVKFAEIMGVQPSNISHILSGRNNPSYDFIVKLLERFPDINPEWILLGKGDVYKCNQVGLNQEILLDTNVNSSSIHIGKQSETSTSNRVNYQKTSDICCDTNVNDKQKLQVNILAQNISEDSAVDQIHHSNTLTKDSDQEHSANKTLNNFYEREQLSPGIFNEHSNTSPRIKTISKIIIFYDDQSFELFQNNS